MLVYRHVQLIEKGNRQEVVELLKGRLKMFPPPHGARIYTPRIGSFSKVVFEMEFESFAEYEAYFSQRAPDAEEYWEKWFEVTANGGGNEFWNLEE